jgi:hypothetical protein
MGVAKVLSVTGSQLECNPSNPLPVILTVIFVQVKSIYPQQVISLTRG